MLGSKVIAVRNFETDTIRDVEGDEIPKEKMLIFELADRTRVAVRGSGTEPKIKYYLFAAAPSGRRASLRPTSSGPIKPQVEENWRHSGSGCSRTRAPQYRRFACEARNECLGSQAARQRLRSQYLEPMSRNQPITAVKSTILKTLGVSGGTLAGEQLVGSDGGNGRRGVSRHARRLDVDGLRRLKQGQHSHDGRR